MKQYEQYCKTEIKRQSEAMHSEKSHGKTNKQSKTILNYNARNWINCGREIKRLTAPLN